MDKAERLRARMAEKYLCQLSFFKSFKLCRQSPIHNLCKISILTQCSDMCHIFVKLSFDATSNWHYCIHFAQNYHSSSARKLIDTLKLNNNQTLAVHTSFLLEKICDEKNTHPHVFLISTPSNRPISR